jgi:hypothetical protein
MADEESEEAIVEKINPLDLFPKKVRKAVEGLVYLGQLTDEVDFCGHTFGIRTLRPQHKYAIAQVLQPYRNTVAEVDIFQNLHVATALTHVDGKQDFCPAIGPSIEDHVRGRLNYVTNSEKGWYGPTLEFLWGRYILLEATAANAIAELNSLSQGSQPTSLSPWLDSLTGPGTSAEQTNMDSLPFMPSN